LSLGTAPDGKTAILLKYGAFIQSVVDFLIVAAVIFMALKGINSLKRPAPPAAAAAPPPPPRQEVLLEEIRDLLARR
jgi:large conductance mechanosensitive channel